MKYLFILVFVLAYILFGTELGYTVTSPFYTHLTYMLQHSTIIHLVINSIAFIAVFNNLQKWVNKWLIAGIMTLSGFIASFLSQYEIPTVGASSMIYGMIGMYISITLFSKQIKIANTRKYLLFLTCIGIGLLVSLLKNNSNFFVHLYSLVIGFVLSVPLSRLTNTRAIGG